MIFCIFAVCFNIKGMRVLFLMLFLASFSLSGQISGVSEGKFNGKVKHTTTFLINKKGKELKVQEYFFDTQQRMIKSIAYTPEGSTFTREMQYDEFGNKIAEIYQGEYSIKNYWKYDTNGKEIENTRYWNDVLEFKNQSVYDKNGNLTETHTFSKPQWKNNLKDSILTTKTIRVYNEKNQCVAYKYYHNNEQRNHFVYKYNEQNLEKEAVSYNPNGEVIGVTKRKYDLNGNLTERETDDFIIMQQYNKKNQCIEQLFFEKNDGKKELTRKETFKYNKKGQVLEHHKYEKNALTETFWQKNKYDRKGNLKEEKIFLDGVFLTVRQKYFPKERKTIREVSGKDYYKTIRKYDQNDNLIFFEDYKNNDKLVTQRTEIEYFE